MRAPYCVSSTTTTTTGGSDSIALSRGYQRSHTIGISCRHPATKFRIGISYRHVICVHTCRIRTQPRFTVGCRIAHQREFADPASWSGKLCTHRATIVNRLCHPNHPKANSLASNCLISPSPPLDHPTSGELELNLPSRNSPRPSQTSAYQPTTLIGRDNYSPSPTENDLGNPNGNKREEQTGFEVAQRTTSSKPQSL